MRTDAACPASSRCARPRRASGGRSRTRLATVRDSRRFDIEGLLRGLLPDDIPSAIAHEPVFGADAVRAAVETRSSAATREGYATLTADTPPAGSEAQGSSLSDAEQVSQAQSDYEDNVANQGILSQAPLTGPMVAHQGDPAHLAELVRLAEEDGTLDAVINPVYGGLYEKDGDAYTWNN